MNNLDTNKELVKKHMINLTYVNVFELIKYHLILRSTYVNRYTLNGHPGGEISFKLYLYSI